jgi:hypothetical protein
MQELSTEDPKGFQNFLRMGKTDFQELLAKVTSHIQRQNTWMREAIHVSAAESHLRGLLCLLFII